MSMDGQGANTKWRRNIAEDFSRLSREHKRYRRQTDGRTGDNKPQLFRSAVPELFTQT